jgi:hypothetical protein
MWKKPSAQPPDPNIPLRLGEAAARRSFFFACGILANVYFWPGTSVRLNAAILPVLGVNRKWSAHARNDADDPKATWGKPLDSLPASFKKML